MKSEQLIETRVVVDPSPAFFFGPLGSQIAAVQADCPQCGECLKISGALVLYHTASYGCRTTLLMTILCVCNE